MKNIFKIIFTILLSKGILFGQTTPVCQPSITNPCEVDPLFMLVNFNISSFTLAGTTVSSSCQAPPNSDETSFINLGLVPGSSNSYTINIFAMVAPEISSSIWLDINMDDDFDDANELLSQNSGFFGPINGSITIPSGLQTGNYRLRIIAHSSFIPPSDPCGTYSNAEVEDYLILVEVPSPCAPTIGSNSPVQVGNEIQLSSSAADTYSWSGPNAFTSTYQSPVINNATVLESGVYTLTVTQGTCTASATTNITVTPICQPNISQIGVSIQSFKLNGIAATNTGMAPPNTNISDFACFTFYKGQSYPIDMGVNGNFHYSIWIDNNGDGDFDDEGEFNYQDNNVIHLSSVEGNLVIPNEGTNGWKHVRIIIKPGSGFYPGPAEPCGNYDVADFRDFLIHVVEHCTANPVEITTDSIACQGSSINLNSTAPNNYCFNWTGPNNFSSKDYSPIISNALAQNAGIYNLHIFDTNGCEASDTTVLTIPIIPNVGSNSPVCQGQTISLFSDDANSYNWTGPNNFSSQLRNPTIIAAEIFHAGTYTVSINYSKNCIYTTTIEFYTSNPYPPNIHSRILPNTSAEIWSSDTGPIKWYDSSTQTNIIGNTSPFMTPVLNSDTDYYFDKTIFNSSYGNQCISNVGHARVEILRNPPDNSPPESSAVGSFRFGDHFGDYDYYDGELIVRNRQSTNLRLIRNEWYNYEFVDIPGNNFKFFLDYNNDGDFSSNEEIQHCCGNTARNGIAWIVFPTYHSGYTWMRVQTDAGTTDFLVYLAERCNSKKESSPLSTTRVCEGENLNLDFGMLTTVYDGPQGSPVNGTYVKFSLTNVNSNVSGVYHFGSYGYSDGYFGTAPNDAGDGYRYLFCYTESSFKIDVIPNQSPISNNITISAGNQAILTATGCTNGYVWYDQPNGGIMLNNTDSYKTPILNRSKNYYVACKNYTACNLSRNLVSVVVNCPSSLSISSPTYTTETVTRQASSINGLITATNQITNTSKITYQSKAILLDEGFKAEPSAGGYFKAEIGGCK